MGLRKCCVCGKYISNCFAGGHIFPANENLSKLWAESIGNDRIINMSPTERRQKLTVCGFHFKKEMFPLQLVGTRLKKNNAVPVLFSVDEMLEHHGDIFKESQPKETIIKEGSKELSFLEKMLSTGTRRTPSSGLDEENRQVKELEDVRKDIDTNELSGNKHFGSDLGEGTHKIETEREENENEFSDLESQDSILRKLLSVPQKNIDVNSSPNIHICMTENSEKTENMEIEKPYFRSLKSLSVSSNSIYEVCRVCFRLLTEEEISKTEDEKQLKDMLQQVLPDIDIDLYSYIVICIKCKQLLKYSYQLQKIWSSTEKQLQRITEEKKTRKNYKSDLIVLTQSKVGEILKCDEEKILENINLDHVYIKTNDDHEVNTSTQIDPLTLDYIKTNDNHEVNTLSQIDPSTLESKLTSIFLTLHPSRVDKIERKILSIRRKSSALGKGPYLCEKCGFYTKKYGSMYTHLRIHKKKPRKTKVKVKLEPKTFKCNICKRLLTSNKRLEDHLKIHQKRYKCGVCDKEVTTGSSLENHIRIMHLGEVSNFQCHLCGKKYPYKTSLNYHLKTTHNPMVPIHQCNICKKQLCNRRVLKKHVKNVHSRGVPVSCQYCGLLLKHQDSLKYHIREVHWKQCGIISSRKRKALEKQRNAKRHIIKWSEEHTALLKNTFEAYILSKGLPPDKEIKKFIEEHEIDRDVRLVKYKIRHLKQLAKKEQKS